MRSLSLALVLLAACARTDPRFASPEQTVRTVLDAYALADVPEEVVRARMAGRGTFSLRDEQAFRESFADHRGPSDDGAAGYVLGRVAAAKDHLTYERRDGRVYVTTMRASARDTLAVLEQGEDGYRILLARSVPIAVRTQLREVYRRRSEQLARRGVRG